MSGPDFDTALRFQAAAEDALRTGDFGAVAVLLAPDVECVTPQHSVHGVDAMTDELRSARPAETLDVEFERGDWKPLGDGRYFCEMRALFRSRRRASCPTAETAASN